MVNDMNKNFDQLCTANVDFIQSEMLKYNRITGWKASDFVKTIKYFP